MQPMKVDILISLFCYAGTCDASVNPELAIWLATTVHKLKTDPRIGRVGINHVNECPTDYARDITLADARDAGFDMILMLDADNWPDARVGHYSDAVPFMDVGFTLAYDRLLLGKPTLIAAPYCSAPASRPSTFKGEVPFVSCWERISTEDPNSQFKIGTAGRQEAALMTGLHRVPAIATGVCLMTTNIVEDMPRPWFYYEFDAKTGRKVSTEDCVFSRNVGMVWLERINEHVVFLAADSWAYHRKPKWVGKPEKMSADDACEAYRRAVLSGIKKDHRLYDVGAETGEALLEPGDVKQDAGLQNYGITQEPTPFDTACDWVSPKLLEKDATWTPELTGPEEPSLEEVYLADQEPDGHPGEPVPEQDIPESGILSLLYAGRRIFYIDSHPLHDCDIDAMKVLYEKVMPSRMVVLFTGIGEAAALFAKFAEGCRRDIAVYCCYTSPIKATDSNLEGHRPPQFVSAIHDKGHELATMQPQELDLIWLGHPPDPNAAMQELKNARRHLRPGGVLAGPANTDTELAIHELGIEGLIQWIDAGHVNSVWYITKPAAKGEAA